MHWDARQHPQRDLEKCGMYPTAKGVWAKHPDTNKLLHGTFLKCSDTKTGASAVRHIPSRECQRAAPSPCTWVHQPHSAPEWMSRCCFAPCCSDLPMLPSESHLQGSLGTFCFSIPNMFLLSNLQIFCVIFAASFSGLSLCPPCLSAQDNWELAVCL